MKIQTKKSETGNLKTHIWREDNLYKFYNLETGEQGDLLMDDLFIQRFKNKTLKDKNEVHLAWGLIQLLKQCDIYYNSTYNFTFYIEDSHIKINLGSDCAYIKNNLPEYEDYLRRFEQEGIEAYIEFKLEENDNNV